jgi:hypothetical protein
MRRWEKLVSVAGPPVFVGGAEYARSREQLRDTNSNPVFQDINREYATAR